MAIVPNAKHSTVAKENCLIAKEKKWHIKPLILNSLVADIYDFYVKVDFDIPFFLNETEKHDEEILELMCGTGRVSIPLLQSGRKMTCVDY